MPTIETRVTPAGVKSYRAKVRLKGAPEVSSCFSSLTRARQWGHGVEAAIREGRHFKTAGAKRQTLADTIDRYVREVLPRKPRTAKFQGHQLAWWRSELGHLFLGDVTASAISAARAKLLLPPGPGRRTRGRATANRYMAVLSHLLTVAVREWELLESNAAHRLGKFKEPRGRDRFLSEEECRRLLEACSKSSNPGLHDVVLLAMSTGMRRGEILGLRRGEVDVASGMIYLYETKNGDRRGVPLAGAALEVMQKRFASAADDSGLVFAGNTGVTPFDIRKPWYWALIEAGLHDVRFHDLRHTAASFLAKGGASLPEIGAVLGHKSAVMTKRYAHFADTHLRDVVASMNQRMLPKP